MSDPEPKEFLRNSNQKALDYIIELAKIGFKDFQTDDIREIISICYSDLEEIPTDENRQYIDNIFSALPPKTIPLFLDTITQTFEPIESVQKILHYLIYTERPIFQIRGLQLAMNLKDETTIPKIVPLIFSHHKPLSQKAIELLLTLKGNAEKILEQYLPDRSPNKRELAIKIMKKLNPSNIKLAIQQLNSEDFLERIEAINVLGETNERKYINKIERLLSDKDLSVKKTAIEAIAKLGGRKAKKILNVSLLEEDYPPMIRLINFSLQTID
jgi:HEAT repeats